jgi:hypothetical protein
MPGIKYFFLFLLFLFVSIYFFHSPHSICAQSNPATSSSALQTPLPTLPPFPSSRALSDYVYSYDQYRQAYNKYVVAKNEYLTYGTLVSKQKALETTKTMLVWRNDVIRTYFLALRQKLTEAPGILDIDKDPVLQTIDIQIKWVEDQKSSLPSAGTLEDLVTLSLALENRYPEIEITYYKALGLIISGREKVIQEMIIDQTNLIRSSVLNLRSAGVKTEVFERWLLEAQTRLDRAIEKHTSAMNTISNMSISPNNANIFSQIQSTLGEENIYLKETISLLSEIIREAANAGV